MPAVIKRVIVYKYCVPLWAIQYQAPVTARIRACARVMQNEKWHCMYKPVKAAKI